MRHNYEGTPLRRFGHFRVTQTKRTPYAAWAVFDERTGDRVLWSFCKASADFGAERLATGRPLETPTEATERSLRLYGSIYPSRLALWDHRYLTIGNGLEWINGGLTSDDVTMLTPEGERSRIEEKERHRAEDAAREATFAELAAETDDPRLRALFAPRPDNFALYRAGTWPEVGDRETLYPASEDYSRLAMLMRMETAAVDPEWMDDARAATRAFLAHGVDMPEHGDGTVAKVRGWAARLAAKHGGEWSPRFSFGEDAARGNSTPMLRAETGFSPEKVERFERYRAAFVTAFGEGSDANGPLLMETRWWDATTGRGLTLKHDARNSPFAWVVDGACSTGRNFHDHDPAALAKVARELLDGAMKATADAAVTP